MTNLSKLPTWADRRRIYAVVETPRGSRAKLEFDSKLGAFTLSKPLLAGLTYPYDWGFLPSTKAPDGDPLDVLSFTMPPPIPAWYSPAAPSAFSKSSRPKMERMSATIASLVPDRSPFEGDLQDIRRLPQRAVEEHEEFFEATNALEDCCSRSIALHRPILLCPSAASAVLGCTADFVWCRKVTPRKIFSDCSAQ